MKITKKELSYIASLAISLKVYLQETKTIISEMERLIAFQLKELKRSSNTKISTASLNNAHGKCQRLIGILNFISLEKK